MELVPSTSCLALRLEGIFESRSSTVFLAFDRPAHFFFARCNSYIAVAQRVFRGPAFDGPVPFLTPEFRHKVL